MKEQQYNIYKIRDNKILITISNIEKKVTIDAIITKIKEKEKGIIGGIVTEEVHLSGNLHYHIFLFYRVRKILTNKRFFYILEKQCNLTKVNNIQGTLEYVKKEGIYKEFGELDKIGQSGIEDVNKKDNIEKIVYERIMQGESPDQIGSDENKNIVQYVLKNSTRIYKAYEMMCNIVKNNKESNKKPFDIKQLKSFKTKSNAICEIIKFIEEACIKKHERKFKSQNLHVFSREPNMGKTSLLIILSEILPTYWYPPIAWFKDYKNKVYSLIVWDEFSMLGWDASLMNRFLEGSPCDLPVKHAYTTKKDNPLVFMCSNRSIREQILARFNYLKCKCNLEYNSKELCLGSEGCTINETLKVQYRTLKARVKEIELKDEDVLFDLIEFLTSTKNKKEEIKVDQQQKNDKKISKYKEQLIEQVTLNDQRKA